MNFWRQLHKTLITHQDVCLLYVLHSVGSSPGRQGFRQFVTSNGDMHGSIGGGVMEQKLVDLAKSLLQSGNKEIFIKKQIHQTNIEKNKSGMICSGEQTVAFYFLNDTHVELIAKIVSAINANQSAVLKLTELGMDLMFDEVPDSKYSLEVFGDVKWIYLENLLEKEKIYIVGGGHVSLALSQCMKLLDFEVVVYDDRLDLNTLKLNRFADVKEIVSYEEIRQKIPQGRNVFVVLMTRGYRSDLIALRSLLGKNIRYLGMLGSAEKVKKLFADLISEGFSEDDTSKVHAPVGVNIKSKTPMEIAISIAAEIISIRNNSNSSDIQ